MIVLGIESSCDECSAALVQDGRQILSNVIATQIPFHAPWGGVVPEIASRKHAEWISSVVNEAFQRASLPLEAADGVAVTSQPGLMGSLLVGLSFAKAFAWARRVPFTACDHMLAHLYASRLDMPGIQTPPPYPFLALLVSGGHTLICRVEDFRTMTVLGTTVDDAAGEAFDKVSKHYGWGYPGGKHIDEYARTGNAAAFAFPVPKLHHGSPYDVSYSGLKTAAIHQCEFFRKQAETTAADLAASFQKAAIDVLIRALLNAVQDTGITTIVTGGGVAANSYLRSCLAAQQNVSCIFPAPELCGDNAAMVAGLGFEYLSRGIYTPFSVTANPRRAFRLS
ncbi:MAG: tRNA (adenosine(37)-N6)-threonylcarbamoyltransferase complex transferase subunit TsaD [Spirochaetaceae bacterium]|jgi:N6-L-threonylcarbamoyladenine synthase|nr:tRNA (adenosine(37)-N6)-threonylcarbamoyltransferase complex transferase subunit TsaD [Spirochaetaceae bacterium]